MKTINDLKQGYHSFLNSMSTHDKELYKNLAKGQSPNIFVLSCADSRVEPNVIFQSEPGEIFTVRNVANLVPPYCPDGGLHSTSAALEFAVTALNVNVIIILGHTSCGGIKACLDHDPVIYHNEGFIAPWVHIAAEARYHILRSYPEASENEKASLLEKEAIRLSMRNLMAFPFVKKAVENKQLEIAGAVFDLETTQISWI